ncbi:MAG: hypothetical protein H6Q23_2344 [Bacteroidetes bacterium]|nr:hypothetical protein [Bacteroidota bacterium]
MKSFERLNTALNHREPDRIPYDIAGLTVTGISKKAFIKAMKYRGLSTEYEAREVDPVQQIVTPSEETLRKLNCDIRRMGARRIPDFEEIVRHEGSLSEVTDIWGCLWRMNELKDIYYNQYTFPLAAFASIGEGLQNYKVPDISLHAGIIRRDLLEQSENLKSFSI